VFHPIAEGADPRCALGRARDGPAVAAGPARRCRARPEEGRSDVRGHRHATRARHSTTPLAADYHLIFADWNAAIFRQAAVFDRLIEATLGGAARGEAARDLLDCACGIGTQALGLAALGYRVTGSDLSPVAIARARQEARRRRLDLRFVVADMRALDHLVPGTFDVVLAADNALPHLLSDGDLAQAIRAIAAKLRPDGLFLASIRDYDDALARRPEAWPARLLGQEGRRRIVRQVWEWSDARRYRVHIYITHETADGWRCEHHVGCYRALPRADLTAALQAGGLGAAGWLMPAETGYHQPIVLARQTAGR
jgi:SAM-dependent methyltransferase